MQDDGIKPGMYNGHNHNYNGNMETVLFMGDLMSNYQIKIGL